MIGKMSSVQRSTTSLYRLSTTRLPARSIDVCLRHIWPQKNTTQQSSHTCFHHRCLAMFLSKIAGNFSRYRGYCHFPLSLHVYFTLALNYMYLLIILRSSVLAKPRRIPKALLPVSNEFSHQKFLRLWLSCSQTDHHYHYHYLIISASRDALSSSRFADGFSMVFPG
jgi:hypothetical protein